MPMETLALNEQNWLEIADGHGTLHYGANQEWYGALWRRKAGCGPTAASVMLAYLAHTRPGLQKLCPLPKLEKESFVAYMDEVWEYVTPGPQGLNTLRKYSAGVKDFAEAQGVELHPVELAVPRKMTDRPGFDKCVSFLRTALEGGCPVAFLNLHKGALENLDSWHWVLITGLSLDGEAAIVTVADGGDKVEIDLRLWYDTTKEGGGFVCVPENPS